MLSRRAASLLVLLGVFYPAVVPAAAAPKPAPADTANAPATAPAPAPEPGKPAVFLDCDECDLDFLREEVDFVSYVRDQNAADVHVIVTTDPTGGGGTAYTFLFRGRRAFAGLADTLRYTAGPADTDDAVRHGVARVLSLGLARYAVRLPIGQRLGILYEDLAGGPIVAERDPWRHWVFTLAGSGYLSGQQATTAYTTNGSLGVDHVTTGWKISAAATGGYSRSRFALEDTAIVSSSHQGEARLLFVRSIGQHWSSGLSLSWTRSTYTNTAQAFVLAPAIEYDVFPYSQSITRQLRFLYRAGPRWYRYFEETIYEKTEEQLAGEELSGTLDLREKWGSAQVKVVGFNYFHDPSKNHLDLSSNLWLRVAQGLSLTSSALISRPRDQLYLPRRGATEEEILLRQRQLASDYTYSVSLGLSFSFGSIYNPVINPRLGE